MTAYGNSRIKIANVITTIDSLSEGQFRKSPGQIALKRLKDVFLNLSDKLDRAEKLTDPIPGQQLIENLNLKIYQILPILGFILRSVNVRNSFEFIDPIQSIAAKALQGRPQVILSSEWDFIPFAWPQSLEDLRSFVLIGLPANESSNALVMPLSGHELGHAVWRNRGFDGPAATTLQLKIADLYDANMAEFKKEYPQYKPDDLTERFILSDCISQSVEFATHHAEELFCDMFAYAIFGESYLHAFAYVLAPGRSSIQTDKYPTHRVRISTLETIAKEDGLVLPTYEQLGFRKEPSASLRDRIVYKMAERGVGELTSTLWKLVSEVVREGKITRPTPAGARRHLTEFTAGSPAGNPACLGDIINAGWLYYLDRVTTSGISLSGSISSLNEMILKSVEILEYRRRLSDGT